MPNAIDALLARMADLDASDLFLTVGAPPVASVEKKAVALEVRGRDLAGSGRLSAGGGGCGSGAGAITGAGGAGAGTLDLSAVARAMRMRSTRDAFGATAMSAAWSTTMTFCWRRRTSSASDSGTSVRRRSTTA